MTVVPNHSIRICADRGGTFCDVHASYPDPENPDGERKEHVVKLLSQDPANYKDAPTEGIRRVLEFVTGEKIPRGSLLKTNKIDYIRLSTTIATNALLERKGEPHVLLITKGFRDLALIGNQSRPKIFDLNIKRPDVLYDEVVEVDERVTLVGYTSDPGWEEKRIVFDEGDQETFSRNVVGGVRGEGEKDGDVVRGLSGEAVRVLKRPVRDYLLPTLRRLHEDRGFKSISICFVHSYTYPLHEEEVASWCKEVGFRYISVSSKISPSIKLLPRTHASLVDAYLTPVLYRYLEGFFSGFEGGEEEFRNSMNRENSIDRGSSIGRQSGSGKIVNSAAEEREKLRVEFMSSSGGLLSLDNFSGLKAILSGPAGGVVGYALTSYDAEEGRGVIGIDIGGTSTDVSRFSGRYETTFESTLPSGFGGTISISSPQLDINTVAAGGGSMLFFRNGLMVTGPESAGADPGPTCYRKGGPLTITDANLVLGRLLPDYFPKIFGKSEGEALDGEASLRAMEELTKDVNQGDEGKKMSVDEVAYGFVKVANETMCRPIRAITEARGYATGSHILASFGGAGGQHACEIAQILGIQTVFIHRYSSILSAYGLALADRTYELQSPSSTTYLSSKKSLHSQLDSLEAQVRAELKRQGFADKRIKTERMLNMRFDGTDTAIMVLPESDENGKGNDVEDDEFLKTFKKSYKEQFGFLLEGKDIIVDDVKVNGIGKTFDSLGPSVHTELRSLKRNILDSNSQSRNKIASRHSVYYEKIGRVDDTPAYLLEKLDVGDVVKGPAMIIDDTQTIVLIPDAEAVVCSKMLVITVGKDKH